MRPKTLTFLMVCILSAQLTGCSNTSTSKIKQGENSKNTTVNESSNNKSQKDAAENNSDNIKNSEPNSNDASDVSFPNTPLDKNSEQFLFGTWKISKLLGFSYMYNDASEYPTGQKVIGDNIIITKDLFSSEGIVNYKAYQDIIKNPQIYIDTLYPNADTFMVYNRIDKKNGDFGLNANDVVKTLTIKDDKDNSYPFTLFIVNNERVILRIEATYFELEKIHDK